MQGIRRDCFKPQAKHIVFSNSHEYFLNYEMCVHDQFS